MSERQGLPAAGHIQLVCLCVQWCGVCRELAPAFQALIQVHPGIRFRWVDIEDEADLVDELDIDTFPTLLLGVGQEPAFYGSVLPRIEVIERLLLEVGSLHLQNPAIRPVLGRVLQRLAAGWPES